MLTRTGSRLCQPPTSERTSKISRAKNVLASHSAPYVVVETDLRPALAFAHTDRPYDTRTRQSAAPAIACAPHMRHGPTWSRHARTADARGIRNTHTTPHTHTQLAQHAAHSHTPKNAVSQRTASDRSCPYVHVRRTRKRRASQSSSSSHITGRARNETVLFAARESGRLPGAGQARAHARADAQTAPPASPHPSETRDHATAMGWG